MSTHFFYDGQGNICDENGRDAMECEEINSFSTLLREAKYRAEEH